MKVTTRSVLFSLFLTFSYTPGNKTVIDLGDPDKEATLALKLQEKAAELLETYKDNPAMLDRLFRTQNAQPLPTVLPS